MTTVLILAACAVVSVAMTALFFAILFTGTKRPNARTHRLGRLLRLSHPNWD
jgi:hypothetical protein